MIQEIDNVAFSAFKEWTAVAQLKVPGLLIHEEDARKISGDFKAILRDALHAVEEEFGQPEGVFEYHQALGYIEGFVMGKIAAQWSFEYLPTPPRLDYHIWFLAFKQYAQVHEETRLKVNRLFSYIKNGQKSVEDVLHLTDIDFTSDQLAAHQIISDMQVDVNWKNFESLFEKYFEIDAIHALSDHKVVSFVEGARIFTREQLKELFHYGK